MSSLNIMVIAVIAAVAIAIVALLVALLAVRRLRQLSSSQRTPRPTTTAPSTQQMVPLDGPERAPQWGKPARDVAARVVEGRVVMTPTSRQIVDATMGRPMVKASILAHGLAHALRPESRDRIRALMRREYNRSRNQRRRAARQAARAATPGRHAATVDAHAWLGELPQHPHARGELEVNR